MGRPGVVIFTDDPGWHGRVLRECFDRHGFDTSFVSLTQCRVELAETGHGMVIPGYEKTLPVAAFVRGVPGGSLEEVVLRLDYLHLLAELGCVVFNRARTIELSVDKAMTSLLLRHHGIPTPVTFASEDGDAARAFTARLLQAGKTVVKKPLFGSQGKGLRRINAIDDLGQLLPGEVAYLQEFIPPQGTVYRDYRVMVIDGQARARMARSSDYWITNRAQGATCIALPPDAALDRQAEAAARAIGADYAGVDLLRDNAGNWLVTEVNGIPAWAGLQQASGLDLTAALVAALCAKLQGVSCLPALAAP